MKACVIDMSRSGEVKILNARITSSVNILAGFYLTLAAEDDPVVVTGAKLKEEGLENIPAFIIPSVEMIQKRNFQFPQMPDKDLRKVLPREIAADADSDEEMAFSYMKNGSISERNVEKIEITSCFCAQQKMFDYLNHLKQNNILAVSIIPDVQGLKTLLQLNSTLGTERTGVVFLELLSNRINLNIFRNKYWSLEREFMYRMDQGGNSDEEDLKEEDFTRISTELNRTFQYFKQRNRSYTIDKVVLYGTGGNTDNLKNLINDNQPVTATVIQPEHFGSKVSFPSHLKDSSEFISIFTLSIATALSVSSKKYLELLPKEYKEKAKLPSRLIGLSIAAFIIFGILAGSTFYFENIKGSYKKDLKGIRQTFSAMQRNAGAIAETRKQRANFFKRRYYLDFPLSYTYSTANFVRKLSLITVPEIELTEILMEPANMTFKFKLDGLIRANDGIGAQSLFLKFYRQLKEFEDILEVNSSKVTVNPGRGKGFNPEQMGDQPSPGSTAQDSVVLYFKITGEVEPE